MVSIQMCGGATAGESKFSVRVESWYHRSRSTCMDNVAPQRTWRLLSIDKKGDAARLDNRTFEEEDGTSRVALTVCSTPGKPLRLNTNAAFVFQPPDFR